MTRCRTMQCASNRVTAVSREVIDMFFDVFRFHGLSCINSSCQTFGVVQWYLDWFCLSTPVYSSLNAVAKYQCFGCFCFCCRHRYHYHYCYYTTNNNNDIYMYYNRTGDKPLFEIMMILFIRFQCINKRQSSKCHSYRPKYITITSKNMCTT